jgi:hypothetical protein
MTRSLTIERGVMTFQERAAGGNTMVRVPISTTSIQSCTANQVKESQEIVQLELKMPVRGRLVLGTRHGDDQETLMKLVKICKSKGIETTIVTEE